DQSPPVHPDHLTPAAARRFALWRAMADLSRAKAEGRLSPEQVRLLESLADNLQHLSQQLSQLADLASQYTRALDPSQTDLSSAPPHEVHPREVHPRDSHTRED
ncbi:MAG: hypothetical protein AB7K36_09580, partial [Chloroflexota bacterium]